MSLTHFFFVRISCHTLFLLTRDVAHPRNNERDLLVLLIDKVRQLIAYIQTLSPDSQITEKNVYIQRIVSKTGRCPSCGQTKISDVYYDISLPNFTLPYREQLLKRFHELLRTVS